MRSDISSVEIDWHDMREETRGSIMKKRCSAGRGTVRLRRFWFLFGSCEFLWSASAYDVSTMCSCGGRVYDTETQEIETGHAHP